MMKGNRIKVLLVLFFLLGVLVYIYFFVISPKNVTEYRSKAAGEISLSLTPQTQTVSMGTGSKAVVTVKIKNITGSAITDLKVVATTLKFSQSVENVFTVVDADIVCDSFFSTKMPSTITSTSLYFTCANMGASFNLNSQEERTVATINLNLTSTPQTGAYNLDVFEVVIPNQSLVNLGGVGLGSTINVSGGPTATATPPGTPTNTPTVGPTNTPQPTPTPSKGMVTATPTMPGTFEKTFKFKLNGVDQTTDATINSFRGTHPVPVVWKVYSKGNYDENTGDQTGSLNYLASEGLYRLTLTNLPQRYQTQLGVLLAKPGKHVGAKFCSVGQTERCPSEVSLAFAGVDFFTAQQDAFVNYAFKPGDVNQDKVLNGVDVVLMLQQFDQVPSQRNTQMDLNEDGNVTAIDYAQMLDSLSQVFDDE